MLPRLHRGIHCLSFAMINKQKSTISFYGLGVINITSEIWKGVANSKPQTPPRKNGVRQLTDGLQKRRRGKNLSRLMVKNTQ